MLSHRHYLVVLALSTSLHAPFAQAEPDAAPLPEEATLSVGELLDRAYEKKAEGDLDAAVLAFEAARREGAKPELIALELGYVAAKRGQTEIARGYFEEATRGKDPSLSEQARAELVALEPLALSETSEPTALPKLTYLAAAPDAMTAKPAAAPIANRWWGDLYAEAYGWHRLSGAKLADDIVPTLRLRALYRLTEGPELNVYGVAQATRDLASTSRGAHGLPLIYADNRAMIGAGAMLRVFERQLGFFAQAGPALDLVGAESEAVAFDLRGGAFLGLESAECARRSQEAAFVAWPCRELYSEAVYVNRFHDNVIGFGRGRFGLTYWAASPLASQLLLEGRAAVDLNGDYYNNFADAGIVNRFRFLLPSRVDLTMGLHGGSYFGTSGQDPAPSPLGYIELRLLAATYLEL